MATVREPRGDGGRGLAIALVILGGWSLALAGLLACPLTSWPVPARLAGAPVALAGMTFLYVGLFITAHEAMHGLVVPARPRLNDALGALATTLFALFSYRRLKARHAEHHAAPASPRDPDFHDGLHRGFWPWYARFFGHYASVGQVLGMALAYNVLHHGLRVAELNLWLFWVAPSLLSSLQLFAFGTYLPHREGPGHASVHRARSTDWPPWLSLLTCYHFGYHEEHHACPWVPWWRLSRLRWAPAPDRLSAGRVE